MFARSCLRDPLGRLTSHLGDPVVVIVVVEHSETSGLCSCGDDQVNRLRAATQAFRGHLRGDLQRPVHHRGGDLRLRKALPVNTHGLDTNPSRYLRLAESSFRPDDTRTVGDDPLRTVAWVVRRLRVDLARSVRVIPLAIDARVRTGEWGHAGSLPRPPGSRPDDCGAEQRAAQQSPQHRLAGRSHLQP